MPKNVLYHPPWKELVDYYKEIPYDSLIYYKDMSNVIKVDDICDNTWILSKFKHEMLCQHDKALENVRNKGYRVVNPNEHSRLTYKEIRRAERRVRRGVEYALHVPFEMLNDREKAQLTLIANRVQSVHSAIVGESKSIQSISLHFDLPSTPRLK